MGKDNFLVHARYCLWICIDTVGGDNLSNAIHRIPRGTVPREWGKLGETFSTGADRDYKDIYLCT